MIINEENYLPQYGRARQGSDLDAIRLRHTFAYLNCEISDIATDLTLPEMLIKLKSYAKHLNDNQDRYFFTAICILAHGDEEHIQCIDGKSISLDSILRMFDSKGCPGMNNKPKIFLSLCSVRGEGSDSGSPRARHFCLPPPSPGLGEPGCQSHRSHCPRGCAGTHRARTPPGACA